MKKWIFVFALSLVFGLTHASVKLAGQIGKYKIAMELVASTSDKNFGVRGKYNYEGKTQSLDVKGNIYGGTILQLTESFQGKETGAFFLEYNTAGNWAGKWIAGSKVLETSLREISGSTHDLEPYSLETYFDKTNGSITGSYVSETYFVNDFNFSDDNPVLEVGFNGGVVTVQELGRDKIKFRFEMTCGPTYHFAGGSGVAIKAGPAEYRYKEVLYDDEGACELTFSIHAKTVDITQISSGMACGFGARAYADGSFEKVNDKAVQVEDELTIEDALGR